MSQLRR